MKPDSKPDQGRADLPPPAIAPAAPQQPQFVVQQTNGQKDESSANERIAWFTLGLLITAIVQAYTFARQSGIMQGQLTQATTAANAAATSAKLAKRTLRITQAAEMFVATFAPNREIVDNDVIHVTIKNGGRTTARKVHSEWAIVIGDRRFQRRVIKPEDIGVLVGPEVPVHLLGTETLLQMAGPDTLKSAFDGTAEMTVEGRITYDDRFGRAHWMTFVFKYDTKSKKFGLHESAADTETKEEDEN